MRSAELFLAAPSKMAPRLPEGLITTNEGVKENIESVDRVNVDDVARLWKGMPPGLRSLLVAMGILLTGLLCSLPHEQSRAC